MFLVLSSVEELSFVEEAIIEKRTVAGSFRTLAGTLETLAGTMKADAEQASARMRVMRDMLRLSIVSVVVVEEECSS